MTYDLFAQPAPPNQAPPDGDSATLAEYAERAYLEYALSVVKGRALPDVCDGLKPVQRRILYAMQRMGLGHSAAAPPRAVKSARVVGDVLGRFHPHSDQAAYDAMVRMAQNFSQRYPLVDGQGNFGSRDGDGAAAMRYTEACLSPIARLLLDELDEGTVAFVSNYDGSTVEPQRLPARLPMLLLNGASGIAVGLATEIPSHNLREVAAAAVAMLRSDSLSEAELQSLVPGPDFAGGGQIISGEAEIADIARSGRGSLKVRARWKIEDLARGQWQLVVTELPPGTSSQKVLEEIEEITNPKARAGKKNLSVEQTALKTTTLALLDAVRDESNKSAAVRLVFEPRSRGVEVGDLVAHLLAHTSLETSVSVNLTGVGADGRPMLKSLRQLLVEWLAFRRETVQRRTQHRLRRVLERIHVLDGRHLVLLNIDEVIRIIRHADDPKAALIERFRLSTIQADDILEIRLRQLARLEAIRIEQELASLASERAKLEDILGSETSLKRMLTREIEADAKQFGDERRTLIQAERRTVVDVRGPDEPVTVVVSLKGWARALKGHEVDLAAQTFKPGDALYGAFACRSVDQLLVFGTPAAGSVRVYSAPVSTLPSGRGDGVPVSSLLDLEAGTQAVHFLAVDAATPLLLSSTAGFGLIARASDLHGRNRTGKSFLSIDAGAQLLPPVVVAPEHDAVACLSLDGRLLVFPLSEIKLQPKGGKGLTLMDVDAKAPLVSVACGRDAFRVEGSGRGGKAREVDVKGQGLLDHQGKRARKGRKVQGLVKVARVLVSATRS